MMWVTRRKVVPMPGAEQFLAEPVDRRPGVPLRVAVYSRLAEGIRKGLLPPGSLVPTEAELGAALGVSRTVVRESLMLLEEDGLVRSRRGVGRLVSVTLPAIGLEQIVPVEQLFATGSTPLRLQRLAVTRQPASEFTAPNVGVQPGEDTHFWETLISRGSEPIAQIQETVAATDAADGTQVAAERHSEQTMLGALLTEHGPVLGPGTCEVSVSTSGPTRMKILDLATTDPVLVLTHAVQRTGRPFYHAKCVVAARAGHLTIAQTHPS
jgi:GntR family transcriptional regulator